MNKLLKPSLGLLALVWFVAGCSTSPFSRQPYGQPTARAPVVDRSVRRPPTAPQPQVDVGRLPAQDPLMPREYAQPYSSAPDPYGAPAYPDAYGSAPARSEMPSERYEVYSPPAYPPGAASPYPSPVPSPGYPADPLASGALPEPQPVMPRTPREAPPPAAPPPAPVDSTVALAPPPAPVEPEPAPEPVRPPARPAPPPRPPADLPPAEITREGNQAVAALLDSADRHVKNNQLSEAGAALERALRIEPRNSGIWHDLAQIRLHQGEYQQAESLASKSNNLAGGNRTLQARNWRLIAVARKATGNTAGAEEAEARASQFSN
ncbi:MAG: tetratricopeptide repeat protein [Candidatus Competibacteraceae bacterium]|nr:tetratricopeptide repeat protein [Candidatus Competibacteraceae bacterium]